MVSPKRLQSIAAVVLAVGFGTPRLKAQLPTTDNWSQKFESRATLEARARKADATNQKGAAYQLHYRLDHGDFQDGDKIFLTFQQGTGTFSDTLVVRAGKRLELPLMGDVPLEGVLRSELAPHLTAHLKDYLRDPAVKALPLVRVGLLGSVARPGYYYAPADMPLSDVLMRAGGPTANADLDKVSIRRLGDTLVDESNTSTALREGMSVDMLGMQAGDEIQVGEKRHTNWSLIIPIASTVLGLILTFTAHH
jgi:protein involved in polysaccharide export with SLBB domain